jgi:nucleotide-binding universal stress UspA family protein
MFAGVAGGRLEGSTTFAPQGRPAMYSDLVIGFDGSPGAHDALAFARALALATGGRPRVVCVRPTGPVEPVLDEARAAIGDVPGVRFEAVSGTTAARGLCEAAASAEAAMIVLGSTHRSGLGAVVAGTTADAVIHAAPCAVAIAPAGYAERGPRRPFGLVVAAIDGGGATERVARIAAGIAEGARAGLRLVSVVDGPHTDGPFYAAGFTYVTVTSARRSAGAAALERAASAAIGTGVAIERRLCEGPLAKQIALESRSADLLVIGSRGLGAVGRFMLAAATGRILRAVTCPVLVVPRHAPARLDDALVPLAGASVR